MILALKTSDQITGMWLYTPNGELVGEYSWESGRALADGLLHELEQFLKSHDSSLPGLTGLIIFSGPGSFTSLRIGHAVLNAVADGLELPIVGAQGDDWLQQGLKDLPSAHLGRPALPHYGADANVTKPRNS